MTALVPLDRLDMAALVPQTPGKRVCSHCGRPIATRLCDWKVGPARCDRLLCEQCTFSPRPARDLCPFHAEEWANREAKSEERAA